MEVGSNNSATVTITNNNQSAVLKCMKFLGFEIPDSLCFFDDARTDKINNKKNNTLSSQSAAEDFLTQASSFAVPLLKRRLPRVG